MQATLVGGLLLITLSQLSLGDFPKNTALDRIDKQCLSELKLPHQLVGDAFQRDYKLTEGNEQVNKYLACVWKAQGYLIEDGSFHINKILHWIKYSLLQTIHAEKLNNKDVVLPEILKDCISQRQGSNLGDASVKIYNCIISRISSRV